MPKPTKGARLGGSPAHQRLMLANLATSLFTHGRITTTEAKAKRLRPYAEKLVSKAKIGDLHNRREVMKVIRDKDVVHTLFAEIGPFFAERAGGYTRIIKTMPRKGDNAPMAIIELLQDKTVTSEADRARRVSATKPAADSTSTDLAPEAAQAAAQEAVDFDTVEAEAETESASAATDDAATDDAATDHAAIDGDVPADGPDTGGLDEIAPEALDSAKDSEA